MMFFCDKNKKGNTSTRCIMAPIETEKSTTITEIITTLLGCAAIDYGFEFGFHVEDGILAGWIKEALLSSGLAATYATLMSSLLRYFNYHHGDRTETKDERERNKTYRYLAATLSQILSGTLAFGIGMLFDYGVHESLDKWENSTAIGLRIAAPMGVVALKVVSRILFFESTDRCLKYVKENFLADDFPELNRELTNRYGAV